MTERELIRLILDYAQPGQLPAGQVADGRAKWLVRYPQVVVCPSGQADTEPPICIAGPAFRGRNGGLRGSGIMRSPASVRLTTTTISSWS